VHEKNMARQAVDGCHRLPPYGGEIRARMYYRFLS
jgi:hypothetical protein